MFGLCQTEITYPLDPPPTAYGFGRGMKYGKKKY
jgi:hypothetical protein